MPLTHYAKTSNNGVEPAVVEFEYKEIKARFECWGCTYDYFFSMNKMLDNQLPVCVIALNAGIWGYESWNASVELFFDHWQKSRNDSVARCYFVITSYTLEESEDDYDRMTELHGLSAAQVGELKRVLVLDGWGMTGH